MDFEAHTDITIGSDRAFGVVLALLFLIVAVYPALISDADIRLWALMIAIGLAAVSFIWPKILHPANVIWIRLGTLLGAVTSPLLLAIVFYAIVTPIAIIARRVGYNTLRLKRPDGDANTYWIARDESRNPSDDMRNQF